ncbi:hypothetical protein [Burkholderia phage BCSR5]|nr:hypothetical protein [Burkholderia phage BCSR5]
MLWARLKSIHRLHNYHGIGETPWWQGNMSNPRDFIHMMTVYQSSLKNYYEASNREQFRDERDPGHFYLIEIFDRIEVGYKKYEYKSRGFVGLFDKHAREWLQPHAKENAWCKTHWEYPVFVFSDCYQYTETDGFGRVGVPGASNGMYHTLGTEEALLKRAQEFWKKNKMREKVSA